MARLVEMTVVMSGFGWEDEPWRWLAFRGPFFAYASTPEEARDRLGDLLIERGVLGDA